MKKSLTILFISLSALLILDSLNAGQALVMFLFAGVIPGTNTTISGATMLEVFLLLSGFTLARLTLLVLKRHYTLRPQL